MRTERGGSGKRVPVGSRHRGDRAVSSTVTHALALSITAILISGLLYSAGGLIQDQREHSAREQLRTVGNRLAEDLSRAATLAQDGGNASFRASHPTSIAGRQYDVRLLTGSDCDTDLFEADTCLSLELQSGGTEVMVPVRNETPVTFEERTTGVFAIEAEANGSAPAADLPTVREDLRVGIGDDVGEYASGSVVNLTNRDPIAGFTFDPGQPSTASVVSFENDTKDLDGQIVDYEWDLGDGTTVSGPDKGTVDHSYATAGKYTVELTVTDDDGETDNVTKVVSVGGLAYNDDASGAALNASAGINDGSIEFNVTNQHADEIVIREVLVDPADDSIDRLDAEGHADEVLIEGDVLAGGYSQPDDVPEDGRIYDIANDGMGPARLSGYSTAQVWLEGFDSDGDPTTKEDMSSEEVFVAMRYEVDGTFYTAQFTLNGPGGSNQPPVPKYDYTCSGTSCTFDDDNSFDYDGTIENFAWNFDDGTTVSGPSEETVSHTFPANGTYLVSMTVTDDDGTSATETKAVQVGDPEPPVIFAVNAGGGEYTANGVTYQGDTESDPSPYLTGDYRVETTTDTIAGTSDDGLYQSARYGTEPGWQCVSQYNGYCYDWDYQWPDNFGYDVAVPNGEYEVTFKFAEIATGVDPGERVFDVESDGSRRIDDLDVYDVAGEDRASDVTKTVTVDDGSLTLDFVPDSYDRSPMVNAIVARLTDAIAFQESGGEVVMEAENYHRSLPGTAEDGTGDDMSGASWTAFSDGSASDGTALEASPNNGDSAGDTENGPRLDYYVDVSTTGTYYVWVRMQCSGPADDSVHVGLDGEPATYGGVGLNKNGSTYCHDESGWMWVSHAAGSPTEVQISSTGQHTVNVWMNDDGVRIDQVVLTTDSSYDPTGTTPAESSES